MNSKSIDRQTNILKSDRPAETVTHKEKVTDRHQNQSTGRKTDRKTEKQKDRQTIRHRTEIKKQTTFIGTHLLLTYLSKTCVLGNIYNGVLGKASDVAVSVYNPAEKKSTQM